MNINYKLIQPFECNEIVKFKLNKGKYNYSEFVISYNAYCDDISKCFIREIILFVHGLHFRVSYPYSLPEPVIKDNVITYVLSNCSYNIFTVNKIIDVNHETELHIKFFYDIELLQKQNSHIKIDNIILRI